MNINPRSVLTAVIFITAISLFFYLPPVDSLRHKSVVIPSSLTPLAAPRRPCPKIFKYPLPDEWLKQRILPRGQADPPFPDPYGAPLYPGGYFATKHKSGPPIFEHLLDAYGDLCTTSDPFAADLFFIPWYRDWFCGVRPCNWYTKASPEEQQLFSFISNYSLSTFGVDFWTKNFGYDHFMLLPGLAAINFLPKDLKWLRGEWQNLTTFAPSYAATFTIPYPTFFHLTSSSSLGDFPWQPSHRGNTVMLALGSVQGIRVKLKRMCDNAGLPVCEYVDVDRKFYYTSVDDSERMQKDLVAAMRNATFCIQYGGEGCGRKGVLDSIVLGCIPVFFSSCPFEFYRKYFDLEKMSVLLPRKVAEREEVLQRLQEISPWEIKEKQVLIAREAHRIQFSKIESREEFETAPATIRSMVKEDAFFRTLELAQSAFHDWQACESMGGWIAPRQGVCCMRSNDCDELEILSVGSPNRCELKQEPPCFFPGAEAYHAFRGERADPVEAGDFLRRPRYFQWPDAPPYSTNTTW